MKISKNMKYGATAVVLTVAVIAVILIVNVFIGIATDRLNLKADMTAEKRYDVSQETVELLNGVKNKITIYVLATEESMRAYPTYGPSVTEILKRYAVLSNGKVDVQFIDLAKNPTFLQGYDVGDISERSLIVRSDVAYRLVTFNDLLYWHGNSYTSDLTVAGLDIERALASAIIYCDTGVTRNAVILNGKGEGQGEKLINFLRNNNFNVSFMNLATDTLPDKTDLVIINSPLKDYTAAELTQLDKFLNQKYGKLIVAMGVESAVAKNLGMYLENYGVKYESLAIYDSKYSLSNLPDAILASTTASDLLSRFSQNNTTIIMPASRPLNVSDKTGTGWARTDLLKSVASSSFAKTIDPNRVTDSIAYQEGDTNGPFFLASLLTKDPLIDTFGNKTYGKILCLSSGAFLNDTYMDSSTYSNSAFMSVVLSDFFGGGDLSRFKVKPFVESNLVTLETDRGLILVFLLALPIALFGAGILVWLRRKNM